VIKGNEQKEMFGGVTPRDAGTRNPFG